MNIIDLGAIDRLVKRNSNLLTSFKIIDDVDGDVAVGNIENSISHFNAKDVVIHNNVVDIVSPDGTISLSYYFSDSYLKSDLKRVFREIRKFCQKSGVDCRDFHE